MSASDESPDSRAVPGDESVDSGAATGNETSDSKTYGGVLGAFPYAIRQSNSRLFRSYVLVGGAIAAILVFAFALSLVRVIGETVGTTATLSFSRSFVIVVGMAVVAPILAPVLLVARRHRRQVGDDVRYDRRLAASGYLFLAALYVGLIPTVPAEFQTEGGPIVGFLYGLPLAVGLAIPALAGAGIYVVHRLSR
ncbi:hypothetical protein ACFQO4_06695 [Saliphagus sp. GCM10025334]